MIRSVKWLAAFALGLGCLLTGSTSAPAKFKVGVVVMTRIESPDPYPPGDATHPIVWIHTLRHPGAVRPRGGPSSLTVPKRSVCSRPPPICGRGRMPMIAAPPINSP